jgi:hypothetical protein
MRWDRWSQQLDVITGELLPGQAIPLLKHRRQLSREQALKLWGERRKQGWEPCDPQWSTPKTQKD